MANMCGKRVLNLVSHYLHNNFYIVDILQGVVWYAYGVESRKHLQFLRVKVNAASASSSGALKVQINKLETEGVHS